MSEYEALARTAQLLNVDFFGGRADEAAIVDELRATTIKIVADKRNLSSVPGQTATVALVQLLEMMGMNTDLAFPDVDLIAPQPPLKGASLRTGLERYAENLIPGRSTTSNLRPPDVTFVIGDTAHDGKDAIRVCGEAWRGVVGPAASVKPTAFSGDWPLGAIAAAGAAAPEALRRILPRMAASLGLDLPHRTHRFETRQTQIDLTLRGLAAEPIDLGPVDFVSGGAITTAALWFLLRIPALVAQLRVIEPDSLELSNLNRYPLALRSLVGLGKAHTLAGSATHAIEITACPYRFDADHREQIGALAPRVSVGVDDIPSRWAVQCEWPEWLCVGATSHLEVRVSAHAWPGPCAGCAHPSDEEIIGEIPTISFVSYWAGVLQARELLAAAAGISPTAPIYWCSPFGLANEYGLTPWALAPRRTCPVACPASAHRRTAA
jgi:hypothetical protein